MDLAVRTTHQARRRSRSSGIGRRWLTRIAPARCAVGRHPDGLRAPCLERRSLPGARDALGHGQGEAPGPDRTAGAGSCELAGRNCWQPDPLPRVKGQRTTPFAGQQEGRQWASRKTRPAPSG
ncbi:hypothetical protein [Glutamicibacter sp. TV12E]|uniref:hypothetical protein n=1 Tax=Glutamicibacter sp. TV12E TaxID=3446362 RepID=UPI004034F6A7